MSAKIEPEEQLEPRPFWRGTLTFGLVSLPVELFPAVRSNRVPLRMIGPNGRPLKRRYFRSTNGKALKAKEIVRGYERDNGDFVVVTDKELAALAPRKSRDIDLRRFVDRNAIPLQLLEQPYVLAPVGESIRAYHLLAATMERSERAGIATFVMRGKEYLAAIFAEGGLLLASTLRFADELRTPEDVGLPEVSEAPAKVRREAQAALKKLTKKKLDRDLLRDENTAAMLALAEKKRSGSQDIVEIPEEDLEDEEELADVIDIMSVLKRRMQGDDESRRQPARKTG